MKNGHVYKRGKKYGVALPDSNYEGGYRRLSIFITKSEAKEYLRQRREQIRKLQLGLTAGGDILYKEFFDDYLRHVETNFSAETLKTYKGILKDFDIFMRLKYPHIQRLSELRVRILEDYKAWLKDTEHKDGTVNNHIKTFRALFAVAVKWEVLDKNPAKNVGLVNVDDEKKIVALDTPERFNLFFNRCTEMKPEYYPHYYCAAKLGLRFGELVSMEWNDIDFERKAVRISCKENFSPKGRSKKDKKPRERIVPFGDDVKETLCALPRKHKCVFLKDGEPISRKDKSFRRWIIAIVRGTELEGMTRFHELRHTTGHILALSHSIHEIRDFLGHADIKTTMRYVTVADAAKKRMAETMARFGSTTPSTTKE